MTESIWRSSRRRSKDDDDDSSSESGSGNGVPALTPPPSSVLAAVASCNGVLALTPPPSSVMASCNGVLALTPPPSSVMASVNGVPLDFSVSVSSSPPQAPPPPPSRQSVSVTVAAAALLGALHPPQELRRKYPPTSALSQSHASALSQSHASALSQSHVSALSQSHASDLRLERDTRDYGSKSPQYSSEHSAEDLTCRPHQVTPDDDDDDHDDHDDTDKMNEAEGVDPERLKAFNMFVRLFVDENLDRMVPISKQPKEKIQAIIESCSRQFPEFQERARKRIRTYLKSCRRMKKNGMETRPTPPHLTSAMAENILAAACESESRNAAKRMRLDTYEDPLEKPSSLREPSSLAHSAYSLAQDQNQIYINGAGLSYGYRSHPVSLSNGPTDLSMKSLPTALTNHSSLAGRGHSGGGGASTQLSQSEVTAVRQLIAGYRESAAFLLRSADELENLVLQQN